MLWSYCTTLSQSLKGNYCSQVGLGVIRRLEIFKSNPRRNQPCLSPFASRVFHIGKSKRWGVRPLVTRRVCQRRKGMRARSRTHFMLYVFAFNTRNITQVHFPSVGEACLNLTAGAWRSCLKCSHGLHVKTFKHYFFLFFFSPFFLVKPRWCLLQETSMAVNINSIHGNCFLCYGFVGKIKLQEFVLKVLMLKALHC